MKKIITSLVLCVMLVCGVIGFTACGSKNITVVAREQGSGTREAFDKAVTDGNGNYLEMKDKDGNKVFNTTDRADLQKGNGKRYEQSRKRC